MTPEKLVGFLDRYLDVGVVQDYCPNGLQVEGRRDVSKIVTGVSASRELFETARDKGADLVLVHHGILWNSSEAAKITGVLAGRIRLLFEAGMSLVAYHLPLDRHMEVGNAAVMAGELGLENLEAFGIHHGATVGVRGSFPRSLEIKEILRRVEGLCLRKPAFFGPSGSRVRTMGIITGSGQAEYHQAVAAGLDAYITGEATEWVMHQTREEGIPYIAAGHYATERFGVQALGRWIEENHHIEVEFIDIPNPV